MGSSSTGAKDDVPDDRNNKGEEEKNESGQFAEGDKVLAYHGPLIYEAKVQRAELRKKEWKYFVHYLGWSKNWDEWVGTDRLMKITEENVQKQQELLKNKSSDKNFKGRIAQSKPRSSTDAKVEKDDVKNYVARGKKRKGDSGVEELQRVASRENDGPIMRELLGQDIVVLRRCALWRVCRTSQQNYYEALIHQLVMHLHLDLLMFRFPVFGDMFITKLDIYKILGLSCVGDLVDLANVRVFGPDATMYLAGALQLTWLTPHGVKISTLLNDNVPLIRRVIATTMVYRISHSQNFGIPYSFVPMTWRCIEGTSFD